MCIHGIQFPSQVSENVPDNVDMPNGDDLENEEHENINQHSDDSILTIYESFFVVSCNQKNFLLEEV